MRILIADDDRGSRIVAQAAVEGLGHQCDAVADGELAWQEFEGEHWPDVLVTDWVMPGISGLDLCRKIRGSDRGLYTYVILLTSLTERDSILAGMEAGADDYLTKPLDPFELRARLLAASRVTALHSELARYRAELARMAWTDPLTGLRNRMALNEDLQVLHASSQRYARPYSVAMCDVDWFKPYNDTYGHPAGDEALRQVAASLAAQARDGDSVYRYGGEEFLVMLPEQTIEGARLALERMRTAVQELAIAHSAGGGGGTLTMSAGIACFDPARPVSSERLLRTADQALYRAKATGRNAVVVAQADAAPQGP